MTLGLMLGILSLTGCQKDNTDSSVNIESEKALSFTLLSEDTRTIYEEGSGVHMTGDEIVAVLYTYIDGTCISAKGQIAQAEKTSANEDGTFNYTFTPNPDAGKSVADYMFVLPYNSDVNFDGASTADDFLSMQSLFTVQEPTATSFDGNSDVLIGRRTAASELETGNANILFKRMFAPLKIVLKGLDANEKVQAVTISTTGTPDRNKNTNILSGASYVVQSPNYDDAILEKWHSSRFSGGLTANYRAGLAANSEGNFDVWFVANPVTLDGIKVSVVTDSRIIERTINKAVPIEPHKLNKMAINMAGDGATSVDAITFNLLGTDNLTTGIPTGAGTDNVTEEFTLSGSDGKAYTWARTGQSLFYKSRGLRFPANCTSYIQLPVFEGQIIQSIRLLQQAATNGTAHNMVLQKLVGEEWQDVETVSVARNMIEQQTYGHIIFTPTDPQAGVVYRISNSSMDTYVSAITVEVIGASDPIASVEFSSAETNALTFKVECNDYATKYYYLCQPAADTAPSVEEVVNNGTESTATELTIENLSEATEYVLYVVPVGENDVQGAVVSAEGKTKSSVSDFYSRWESGEDIVIGDLTVNNTNYPNAVKVNISELKNKDFTDGGLIFIEGEGSYTMTASPALVDDCIVIGNDPKYQPSIIMHYVNDSGNIKANYFALRAKKNFVFKNLKLNGDSNNYLFANTDATNASGEGNLYIEDCTISTNGNVISDSNTTLTLASVYINNCVIDFSTSSTGKAIYGFATKLPNKGASTLLKVTVTNNVVYSSTTLTNYLVMIGGDKTTTADFTAYATVNAEVVVNQNTTYGLFHTNGLVSVYSAKSVTALNNLHYFDNNTSLKTSYDVGYYKSGDTTVECKVRNNAAYTNNEGTQYWKPVKNSSYANTSAGDNLYKLTDEPFSSVDLTTGYLPVDASVVTNGAGATYETKLWYNWGE